MLVRDRGRWQPQTARDDRGLGLRLIRSLMESVEVSPGEGGTVVRMERRVGSGGDGSSSPLEIGVAPAERDGLVVLSIAGELDLTTVSDADARLAEASDGDLVLDLTGLTFLDSAAVHLLFRTVRRFREQDRRLAFVVPTGSPAHRIVEILDLRSAAPVRSTLEEAMRALDPASQ